MRGQSLIKQSKLKNRHGFRASAGPSTTSANVQSVLVPVSMYYNVQCSAGTGINVRYYQDAAPTSKASHVDVCSTVLDRVAFPTPALPCLCSAAGHVEALTPCSTNSGSMFRYQPVSCLTRDNDSPKKKETVCPENTCKTLGSIWCASLPFFKQNFGLQSQQCAKKPITS